MNLRSHSAFGALFALAILVALSLDGAKAASTTMNVLDPDRDGTIDMAEALSAGAKVFARINPDNDGTLTARELRGRMSAAQVRAADPDNDGTLDGFEYSAVIMGRFKRANPDNDGTIDDRELHSGAGRALLLLIR